MARNKKLNTDQENTSTQVYDNPQHLVISSTNSRSEYQHGNKEEDIYNDDIIYQFNLDDWQG